VGDIDKDGYEDVVAVTDARSPPVLQVLFMTGDYNKPIKATAQVKPSPIQIFKLSSFWIQSIEKVHRGDVLQVLFMTGDYDKPVKATAQVMHQKSSC
jgi:hypothetical protein